MRVARFGSIAGLTIALTFTASALRAQGAAAVCKDGTKSATSGRGACSGHGGVDSAATAAAKKSSKAAEKSAKTAEKNAKTTEKAAENNAKTEAKSVAKTSKAAEKAADKADKDAAGAIAQCKDGTYSHAKSTRGACSSHGGIAKTLKP